MLNNCKIENYGPNRSCLAIKITLSLFDFISYIDTKLFVHVTYDNERLENNAGRMKLIS